MTKIKKIYYPILAVCMLLALVLGLVAAGVSFGPKANKSFADEVHARMAEYMNCEHNSFNATSQKDIRTSLFTNSMIRFEPGLIESAGGSKSDGYLGASFGADNTPSYLVQEATLTQEALNALAGDDETVYAVKDIANIIVAIPGTNLDEAVLFIANYDSAAGSQSATESMQSVALLQTAISYAKDYQAGKKPNKTLVFLISDAEHEGAYGTLAFKYQFKGFDDVVSKIGLVVNFGAKGTGALSVEASKVSVSSVRGYASGLTESIGSAFDETTDYDVFDCAKINIFFGGTKDYLNTSRDTVDRLSDSKIKTIGGVMDSLVSAYGFGKVKTTDEGGAFSYIGGAFSYSKVASYVLGAISIVLLGVAIFMMIRSGKKADGILRGFLAQIAAIAISAVILYACYFLLALILAGFGAVPIHAITTIRYMNFGLFISALLLAFAAYAGVFLLVRRFYKVKATDGARGAALLIMLVGIVMSFALPTGSLGFAISALLEGVALILTSVFAGKFKSKFDADIERLFAYLIPIILLTPAMIPVMVMTSYTLDLVYFPLILTVATLGMAVIAPYFGMLKDPLSAVAAKLPKHTIRVEKVVTERVEGPKKGRFTEVTHKKVVNEKVEWKYRNRYGIAILGVLSAVLIILFAVCPANHFSSNIISDFSYREAAMDDSLVFYWEQSGADAAASAVKKFKVYDQSAYRYIAPIDRDFKWNSSESVYEKDFLGDVNSVLNTSVPVTLSSSGNELSISAYNNVNGSLIDIVLTNMSAVTKVTIDIGSQIEVTNDGKDTMRLYFPYGDDDYANFKLIFEIDADANNGSSTTNIGVNYTQYISGARAEDVLNRTQDYIDIRSAFTDKSYSGDFTCGVILSRHNSFLIG